MESPNFKVQIDREGFKNACIKHTGIPFNDMTSQTIEECAKDFGISIHLHFARYFLCIVKDEQKLFMNRLKYGF